MKPESANRRRSVIGVAVRTLIAVPLYLVGVMLIYGFGAGYFSRFYMAVPTPLNLVVSLALLIVFFVGLFMFVVPDPGEPDR